VIYGKLTIHDRQTDRQTKFTLRSLERGLLTLAPMTFYLLGIESESNSTSLVSRPTPTWIAFRRVW